MATGYIKVEHSTFLDAFGDGLSTSKDYNRLQKATSVEEAQKVLGGLFRDDFGTGPRATVAEAGDGFTVVVGLVLDRAHDPTELLAGNWGDRQKKLTELHETGTLWQEYGASATTYTSIQSQVGALVGGDALQDAQAMGYQSTAENRTIWLDLDAATFQLLFGKPLLTINGEVPAWYGDLELPEAIAGAVKGIWVDKSVAISHPAVLDSTPATLDPVDGYLGVGNGSPGWRVSPSSTIAAAYDFPDLGDTPTSTIALVEPTEIPDALYDAYAQYRDALNLGSVTPEQFVAVGPGAGLATDDVSSELTMDISVVAGAAPQSTQVLYAGWSVYQAYQSAFFDDVNAPSVLSSSWSTYGQPTADSPFQRAYLELFIDGALARVSSHIAAGDFGAGIYSNGVAGASNSQSPATAIVVGGTSQSSLDAAKADKTLSEEVASVLSRDPDLATLWGMVASGLKASPYMLNKKPPPSDTFVPVFETVWNDYTVGPPAAGSTDSILQFGESKSNSSGGVNGSIPLPDYQSSFGLSFDGRGMPDVAALAGGNARYQTLNPGYVDGTSSSLFSSSWGTSTAAPLWASLTAAFNAVFADHGLPQLGYYNDLLYIAAAIAPASFNDITQGNNRSSFIGSKPGSGYVTEDTQSSSPEPIPIVPTGQGNDAGPGYDLVTGLGSPNGVLLGRALLTIANSQTWFGDQPDMLIADGGNAWTSGADQTLMLQAFSPSQADVAVTAGSEVLDFGTGPQASYAWTARFAQQAMQVGFDRRLVRSFDKQSQGTVAQVTVEQGESLAISIDAATANAAQGTLTSPFGFADFATVGEDAGTVRVALPVAIAETANGVEVDSAIVRLRDSGRAPLSVTFYQVDDLMGRIYLQDEATGAVDIVAPGDADYAAAANARAYQTSEGPSILDPGAYGFKEAKLLDVHEGDIVAMFLTNEKRDKTYWAFSQANEVLRDGRHVGHLWSYGLNTWGWEEGPHGGDRDYNDLVVQLDFVSGSHSGLLS